MGILGDIGQGIGGFIGSFASQDDRDKAAQDLEQGRKAYEGLDPSIIAPTVNSAFETVDPSTRSAQLEALQRLQTQFRSGGLDAIDRARLNDITTQQAQTTRAGQAAVQQEAARRGLGSSATSLMLQQLAGQQGANTGSQQALDVAAQGEAARRAEIVGAAGVAGQVRGQDYGAAAARDAIARFNAANRMGAQEATFNNSATRAGGIAGGYGAQAGQANLQAQATMGRYQGLGRGVGAVGDAAVQASTGGFNPMDFAAAGS